MVTKHHLGVGYLLTVGVLLSAILLSGTLFPTDSTGITLTPNTAFATMTGLLVASGFIDSGVGLANSHLAGESVWRVALLSTIGLGIPTILFLVLMGF